MRLLDFRGTGPMGARLCLARVAVLVAVLFAAPALAQELNPSAEVYRGPKCFNTVIPDVVATVARITGARFPGKETYSVGDELFVEVEEGPLTEGTEYLVYRVEGRIRHPRGGDVVGSAINLVGQVRVLETDGARGLVEPTEVCGELEAGDRLHVLLEGDIGEPDHVPDFEPVRLIEVADADATVVFGSGETLTRRDDSDRGSMTEQQTYAIGEVVTIDRGQTSGWTPGAWGLFYNDGLPSEAAETVRLAGPVISAQGYVIWATDSTAALMITQAQGAVMLGNRARLID